MAAFYYYNWEEVNINWDALDLNWEEVGVLQEVAAFIDFPPIGKPSTEKPWYSLKEINKLPEEKKRIIIKIVAKIEGKEITEYKYKNDSSINITAEHIDTILNEIASKNNIKIKIKNIK